MAVEHVLGGGTLEIARQNSDGTFEAFIQIGEVNEGSITSEQEVYEFVNNDSAMEVVSDSAVVKTGYSITFDTQNLDKVNLALAFAGTAGAKTYAIGDELLDGTTAIAETTVDTVSAGTNPTTKGKVRYISSPNIGKKVAIVAPLAVISSEGDFSLINKEAGKLNFTAKLLKVDGENYFDMELVG